MQTRSSAYWLFACLAVVALAGLPTVAAADDADTCAKQSGDVAIAACSRAIASGKFRGEELAAIYVSRGVEYKNKRGLDRAIADFDQAIRLEPKNADAYTVRGMAWEAKGDFDRAIADFDQAIRLDPKNSSWYFHRGLSNLYAGALPTALADLNQASELNPKHAYAALWLDIVKKRSNLPSRLAEAAKQINMTWWPAPVIRLYLGQLTPEAVLAAADDANPRAKQGRVCEANFYAGELALQQGNADEAKRLFALAAADCPKDFAAYAGATAELKVLGARP
jgi:lipoprotein NlpI